MVAVVGAVDAGIVIHNTVSAIGGILNVWSGLLGDMGVFGVSSRLQADEGSPAVRRSRRNS